MRLLLDTHIFLWVVTDSDRLSTETRALLVGASHIYVSSVAIWEVAIKSRLGKINADPRQLVPAIEASGCEPLPVTPEHAAATALLPDHHRDPFDRLLVAQARTEPLRLVTADRLLARYGDLVHLV